MTAIADRLRTLGPYGRILALLVATFLLANAITAERIGPSPIIVDAAAAQALTDASFKHPAQFAPAAFAITVETEEPPAEAMADEPTPRPAPAAGTAVQSAHADVWPASMAPGRPDRPPRAA